MAMPKLSDAAEQEIANIALEHLDVETFERQRVRRKDFPEIPVWDLRRALEAAYLAGMVDHYRKR